MNLDLPFSEIRDELRAAIDVYMSARLSLATYCEVKERHLLPDARVDAELERHRIDFQSADAALNVALDKAAADGADFLEQLLRHLHVGGDHD